MGARKKKNRQPASKKTGSETSSVSLHFIWTGSLVAGAALANVNATGLGALSTRFLTEADGWALFKYTSFKFRVHPSNVSANQVVGFTPIADTSPSTIAQVMELRSSVYIDQSQTVPTEWIDVAPGVLHGQLPWYRTVDGSFDVTEENPGRMIIVGTGTDTFAVEFKTDVKFKDALAPANTPQELKVLHDRRDSRMEERDSHLRAALMQLLQSPPVLLLRAIGKPPTLP